MRQQKKIYEVYSHERTKFLFFLLFIEEKIVSLQRFLKICYRRDLISKKTT